MLALLVALLLELGAPAQVAPKYAVLLEHEERAYHVPAEAIAAVCAHESRWDEHARGALGEIGLCQLLRGTVTVHGFEHLTDAQLERPAVQFRLAARRLARLRDVCGGYWDLKRWISPYSGRQCGPSCYSNEIVVELDEAKGRVLEKRGSLWTTHLIGLTALNALPKEREPICYGRPLWCEKLSAPR